MSDNEQDAEFPVEDPESPRIEVEPEKTRAPRKGIGVAWLALLLAAAAATISAWGAYNDWRTPEDTSAADAQRAISSLRQQVASSDESLAALEASVAAIPTRDYGADIDNLRRDIDEQLRTLGSLPPRMTTLENSVASLAGISAGARETFLLAEAEYYMQIANAQLQLANDPVKASLALRMADERVTQLADPGLTDVRRALSDELAALDGAEMPDIAGASLKLSSLAGTIDALPIAQPVEEADADEAADDDEESTLGKAWGSVKGAMGNLVRVTPVEDANLVALSPDAQEFLRSNIALQLQAARLALLRGEQAIFVQTLDDTTLLLNTYFDTDSDAVSSALATISEVREENYSGDLPDISASLRLLRQFRTVSETVE